MEDFNKEELYLMGSIIANRFDEVQSAINNFYRDNEIKTIFLEELEELNSIKSKIEIKLGIRKGEKDVTK